MRMEIDLATAFRCKATLCLRRARDADEARRADLLALAADYARRAHAETAPRLAA